MPTLTSKVVDLKNMKPIDRFLFWVKERESIRLKKEAGKPKPWTDCKELQGYRYCNVRRADDKVTVWLLENWYRPYFDHPNMLTACSIARHFNTTAILGDTTKYVFPKYDPVGLLRAIQARKSVGLKVFSAAYMIHADKSADKSEMVINRVVQPIHDKAKELLDTISMERSVGLLTTCWNIGSFMAGQIVADARWAIKGTWADKNTWAPIGPGSSRGMNRLHGRDIKYPINQQQFLQELNELVKLCKTKLPTTITSRLEYQDWQSCLCETDKFNRLINGEGRPKQTYPGVA